MEEGWNLRIGDNEKEKREMKANNFINLMKSEREATEW